MVLNLVCVIGGVLGLWFFIIGMLVSGDGLEWYFMLVGSMFFLLVLVGVWVEVVSG